MQYSAAVFFWGYAELRVHLVNCTCRNTCTGIFSGIMVLPRKCHIWDLFILVA